MPKSENENQNNSDQVQKQVKKSNKRGSRSSKPQFSSWVSSRRRARTKGPWRGVFRDPVKLYLNGVVMGHRRSRMNIHPHRTLVKIEDVKTAKDARYYLGHRVLYIYRAAKKIDPKTGKRELRVIAGKITRPHGNNGTVRVNFQPNLPTRAFGKRVRVMLWPHRAPN